MPKTKGVIHKDSNNARLYALDLGEYFYVECGERSWCEVMRVVNAPKCRRPVELSGREFTATGWTAVSPKGDTKRLVRVERVK